jgi:hypothetical protein
MLENSSTMTAENRSLSSQGWQAPDKERGAFPLRPFLWFHPIIQSSIDTILFSNNGQYLQQRGQATGTLFWHWLDAFASLYELK